MRVLVTAASRHQSTAELARLIGGCLTDAGLEVALLPPDDVREAHAYDGVVLGSAVYSRRWLEPAIRLVERLGPELADRPVWLFSSGPVGDPPQPAGDPVDVDPIRRVTHARDHRVFAGRIVRSRLGFGERLAASIVGAPEGDFRPISDVRQWAAGIARTLFVAAPT